MRNPPNRAVNLRLEKADFWPNFNFAAIFGNFYIMKCDESKSVSRYGLYRYIGEKNRVKKNREKWHVDSKCALDRIFQIFDWLYLENYAI